MKRVPGLSWAWLSCGGHFQSEAGGFHICCPHNFAIFFTHTHTHTHTSLSVCVSKTYTGRMGWISHRKWKETKQLPGTARPGNMLGCCLNSFHFMWVIHSSSSNLLNILTPFPPSLRTSYMESPHREIESYNYVAAAATSHFASRCAENGSN